MIYQYFLLFGFLLGALGIENELCSKKIRTTDGSEVTHTEEWECCPGFTEVADKCTKCPSWTFGRSCIDRCRCDRQNTKYCDHVTGSCVCQQNWTGETCSMPSSLLRVKRGITIQPCSNFTYGQNCSKKCECDEKNAIFCDNTFGTCSCEFGWKGTFCNETCTDWSYGLFCQQPCDCNRNNTAICHHVNGQCICKPGYHGYRCDEACPEYFYGVNCEDECACDKFLSTSCDPVTGECNCAIGYDKPHCNTTCRNSTYGQNCSENCLCDVKNTAYCDVFFGTCICDRGWKGASCNETCTDWLYGIYCDQSCDCNRNNTAICHHVTGECMCKPGYHERRCDEVCPEYFYGVNCQGECACDKNLSTSCDAVTGECNCITGYDKPNCNTTCPGGFYGHLCANTCSCPPNAYSVCDHITGACACKPGNVGAACERECPDGSHGVNCFGVCDCLTDHTAYCDKATGVCVCDSGWEGTRCDTEVHDAEVLFMSPLIASLIAIVATMMLWFFILSILWKICRCSCAVLKHRANRDKGTVILMDSPITAGSNNAAIAAIAASTTPLKHDGIYYYSKDLIKTAEADDNNLDKTSNNEDTNYYDGILGTSQPANSENMSKLNDGQADRTVHIDVDKLETGSVPVSTSSYQNVPSLDTTQGNISNNRTNHPALPRPPPPPVPSPEMAPSTTNTQDNSDVIYRNEMAETSFASNSGPIPHRNSTYDNYEQLHSNNQEIANEYAELK